VSGGLNFVMFGAATLVSGLTSAVRPHRLRIAGGLAMVLAAILLLGALAGHALPLIWAAAVVAGLGSGSALSGSTRGLVPQVEPHERAGLFSAIFTVAYVTLSVAIIGGGFLAGIVGAGVVATGYAILLAVVALVGVALGLRVVSRGRTAATTAIAVAAVK
jgi:hypothetical protein